MIVLGINSGKTRYGKKLKDGGACLVNDNKILASISEERLTRRKSEGGYENSVKTIQDHFGIKIAEIDQIVISSCCELSPIIPKDLGSSSEPVKIVPHHLSHAFGAFIPSEFDEALIIVMDAGGDVIDSEMTSNNWWRHKREQNSYYIGRGSKVHLVGRDFDEPLDVGFGESFRAFTKYFGWKTEYTGKLMALAGLVGENPFAKNMDLFYNQDGKIKNRIRSNPKFPVWMINKLNQDYQFQFAKSPFSEEDILQYAYIAHYMQSQYEKYLFLIIERLIEKFRIRNICISGGVGLNCVANGKILQNTSAEKVYVPVACGDQGQCIGNAYYGLYTANQKLNRYTSNSAFLGIDNSLSIDELIKGYSLKKDYIIVNKNVNARTAILLNKGLIGAIHHGRSEFGPRALGNRSIVAEPSNKAVKDRLNTIKGRESFNPFAVSILEEYMYEYFYSATKSPYMQFAFRLKDQFREQLQGIIHSDHTCRVHTVEKHTCENLHNLISEYKKISGYPMIINTSLNSKDEPICTTIEQSFNCFLRLKLDFIVINNLLIFKRV